jgi:hypothetical protein
VKWIRQENHVPGAKWQPNPSCRFAAAGDGASEKGFPGWRWTMNRILLLFLLVFGLSGCAETQKPNPLPRAGAGVKMDKVEPLNPLPKEAVK